MASGLPDYSRGVNIKQQDVTEVIVRPKYGGAVEVSGNQACGASGVTLLASISGKGMIYGGSVWLDYTSSQANAEIMMKLDGMFIFSPSFVRMNDYGIYDPRSSIITLNKYDVVNHIYSVGLGYGITFESSLDLGYNEQNGTTPTVHFNVVYALI